MKSTRSKPTKAATKATFPAAPPASIDRVRELVVGGGFEGALSRLERLESSLDQLRHELQRKVDTTAGALREDDDRTLREVTRVERLVSDERRQRSDREEELARQLEAQATRLSEFATRVDALIADLTEKVVGGQRQLTERMSELEKQVDASLARQRSESDVQRAAIADIASWREDVGRQLTACLERLDAVVHGKVDLETVRDALQDILGRLPSRP